MVFIPKKTVTPQKIHMSPFQRHHFERNESSSNQHIFSIDMLVFGGQPNSESNMSDTKNSDVEDSDLDIRGNLRGKNSPL